MSKNILNYINNKLIVIILDNTFRIDFKENELINIYLTKNINDLCFLSFLKKITMLYIDTKNNNNINYILSLSNFQEFIVVNFNLEFFKNNIDSLYINYNIYGKLNVNVNKVRLNYNETSKNYFYNDLKIIIDNINLINSLEIIIEDSDCDLDKLLKLIVFYQKKINIISYVFSYRLFLYQFNNFYLEVSNNKFKNTLDNKIIINSNNVMIKITNIHHKKNYELFFPNCINFDYSEPNYFIAPKLNNYSITYKPQYIDNIIKNLNRNPNINTLILKPSYNKKDLIKNCKKIQNKTNLSFLDLSFFIFNNKELKELEELDSFTGLILNSLYKKMELNSYKYKNILENSFNEEDSICFYN